MKHSKHISKLNFALFLVSFVLVSSLSITNKSNNYQVNLSKKQELSQQDSQSGLNSQQLSEETENKSEKELEPVLIVLPFLISFQTNLSVSKIPPNTGFKSLHSLQPIYISTSNFRI